MADNNQNGVVSQVTTPDGTTYDIKDTTARTLAAAAVASSDSITTQEINTIWEGN